jgi:hypothetical protein
MARHSRMRLIPHLAGRNRSGIRLRRTARAGHPGATAGASWFAHSTLHTTSSPTTTASTATAASPTSTPRIARGVVAMGWQTHGSPSAAGGGTSAQSLGVNGHLLIGETATPAPVEGVECALLAVLLDALAELTHR